MPIVPVINSDILKSAHPHGLGLLVQLLWILIIIIIIFFIIDPFSTLSVHVLKPFAKLNYPRTNSQCTYCRKGQQLTLTVQFSIYQTDMMLN